MVATESAPAGESHTIEIKAISSDLGLELDPNHQEWCAHVWKEGGRFCVLPARLPAKGMGMVAARDIIKSKPGEEIAQIPSKLLFNTDSIPSSFKRKHNTLKVHGLLAAALALDSHKDKMLHELWQRTWPTMKQLEASIPILLPKQYGNTLTSKDAELDGKVLLLPPAISGTWIDSTGKFENAYEASGALSKQEAKLTRELEIMRRNLSLDLEDPRIRDVEYMWLMVNTRSFYYDMPLRTRPKTNEDKMCLCPFLDYFNHDTEGCNVSYDTKGFSVNANRAYSKGEEVIISYGSHDNDLLWSDYGFLLDQNEHDSVCIDAWMLDSSIDIAGPESRRLLEDSGYWRNYTITKDGPCFRTEIAIRTQLMSRKTWTRHVAGEKIKMSDEQIEQQSRQFLKDKILKPCVQSALLAQKCILSSDLDLPAAMLDFATKRWKQIQVMAEQCM